MTSDPSGDQYRWRETYFIWFDSARHPQLKKVEETVRGLRGHFELDGGEADHAGRIQSLTIRCAEDHSALEIDFTSGDEMQAEAVTLAAELKSGDGIDPAKLARLTKCDGRFDIMHFEAVFDGESEEEADEMFDPSALLIILEALTKLTGGVAVDPQSGILM